MLNTKYEIQNTIFGLLIFLFLISFPIAFNFWLINSFDDEAKKRIFIEEKIKFVYYDLAGSTPRVSVVEEEKTLHLKKDISLKEGDLVYFYDSKDVAVLVDGQTEDILGIVSQRNL